MAERTGHVYPITRLVAVNADGTRMKVLLQDTDARTAQYQDRILDWTPQDPDTVLIQLDDDSNGFPSVLDHTRKMDAALRRANKPIAPSSSRTRLTSSIANRIASRC